MILILWQPTFYAVASPSPIIVIHKLMEWVSNWQIQEHHTRIYDSIYSGFWLLLLCFRIISHVFIHFGGIIVDNSFLRGINPSYIFLCIDYTVFGFLFCSFLFSLNFRSFFQFIYFFALFSTFDCLMSIAISIIMMSQQQPTPRCQAHSSVLIMFPHTYNIEIGTTWLSRVWLIIWIVDHIINIVVFL